MTFHPSRKKGGISKLVQYTAWQPTLPKLSPKKQHFIPQFGKIIILPLPSPLLYYSYPLTYYTKQLNFPELISQLIPQFGNICNPPPTSPALPSYTIQIPHAYELCDALWGSDHRPVCSVFYLNLAPSYYRRETFSVHWGCSYSSRSHCSNDSSPGSTVDSPVALTNYHPLPSVPFIFHLQVGR